MNERGRKRKELSRNPIKTGVISKVMHHPGSNRKSILKYNEKKRKNEYIEKNCSW